MSAAGGLTSEYFFPLQSSPFERNISFVIYFSCIEANLNGVYRFNPSNNNYVGIIWEKWLGDYSLKTTKMMVRPKIDWSSTSEAHDDADDDTNKKPPDDP